MGTGLCTYKELMNKASDCLVRVFLFCIPNRSITLPLFSYHLPTYSLFLNIYNELKKHLKHMNTYIIKQPTFFWCLYVKNRHFHIETSFFKEICLQFITSYTFKIGLRINGNYLYSRKSYIPLCESTFKVARHWTAWGSHIVPLAAEIGIWYESW